MKYAEGSRYILGKMLPASCRDPGALRLSLYCFQRWLNVRILCSFRLRMKVRNHLTPGAPTGASAGAGLMKMPQIDGGFRVVVFIVGCNLPLNAFLSMYFRRRQRLLAG